MFKKYQMQNGLTVILAEAHKSPVVTVQMWVKTGSADEGKKEKGISHFIEHLVFKGSDKFGVGEMASTVEASGGELNAYTSFDETVFYVTISKNFSDVALDVVSEMMLHPTFDEKEIDNEREVVIEEIKRTMDSPARESSRLLFSTAYKKHPYGIPVIGYPEIVKKVSKKTMTDYFHSRYTPKQMTLLVVGDFEPKAMKNEIEKRFSDFGTRKFRKVVRTKETGVSSPRIAAKKTAFEEAFVNIAWRGPKPTHKDVAALDILGLVLGQGDSSRLVRRVRLEQPIATSVSSGLYAPKDGGFFTVSGTMAAENIELFLEGVEEELVNILGAPPRDDEMKKALTNFASEELYSLETVDGLARKFGFYENLMGDPGYFDVFMKRVKSVTAADISKIARKYFNPKNMVITATSNRDAAKVKKILGLWHKKFAALYKKESKKKLFAAKAAKGGQKVLWKAGRKSGHEVRKIQLPNGVTLIALCNEEAPTISARAAFLGGLRAEGQAAEGLTELMAATWTAGTERRSESEVYAKTESLAANLSAFGGRNSAGVAMELLAPFEKDALELFLEVLTVPRFAEDIVSREKKIILENIKTREDRPSQLVIQQFMKTMFAGHPYGRDLLGTYESVSSIHRDEVVRHWEKMASKKNLTISISGNFDLELWKKRITEVTDHLGAGHRFHEKFATHPPGERKVLFKKLEKEQAHIVVGYPGLAHSAPERYPLQVIQSVLAGQGGRLFIELRDKKSLAYSVSPIRMEGIETGYFGGYIGCSPEKSEIAIQMLEAEFAKMAETTLSSEELSRAKRYLIGRHDIELQRNAASAGAILFDDLYGLPFDETFRYADHINAVTAEEVRRLAGRIFSQPPIVSVVGPRAPA